MKLLKQMNTLWLEYGLLALVIMFPLLKPGFIQTIDMPWGPYIPLPNVSDNSYFFVSLLHGLALVISSMVVQKLLLLSLFILMGVGAHRFALLSEHVRKQPLSAYAAGVLYACNPFVYTRLMQGQWLVLCGYALLPWAIGSFWWLMRRPSWAQTARASAWTIAVGLTSIHAVGFVLLAHAVLFVASGRVQLKRRLLCVGAATLAWLIANSPWLVPILDGRSHTSTAISSFGASQLQAFMTVGSVHGSVPLSTVLLEGFWADPQGRYVLPSHLGASWFVVAMLILAVIVVGALQVIRRRNIMGICLLGLGIVAWWLGMGIGWHYSAGTTNWLIAHVPFYRGYREPQKWLMVLALVYSYYFAYGTAALVTALARIKKLKPKLIRTRTSFACFGLAALLPILWTPSLLAGAGGQLRSARYPADYATIEHDMGNYKGPVLVLPWHEYLPLGFAGRVVANPASTYFTQPTITGDNPELQGLPNDNSSPLYKMIDTQLIPDHSFRHDAGAQIDCFGIKYVILLKEADYLDYRWLNTQHDLKLVDNQKDIILYEVSPA